MRGLIKRAGNGSRVGQSNRAAHCQSCLPDPNAHLTPFMAAESTAFATLVTSRLDPARMYELFVDDANYADVCRALSPADSSWPLNRLVPFLRRREICQSLAGKDVEALLFDAGIVVAALSTRLGDRSKYFYGDTPSVLDAIVFGQLAVALLVPLTRPRLRTLVAGYPNLMQFVDRIRMEYFREDSEQWTGRMDNEEAVELCRAEAERRAREESSRRAAEQRAREARDGAPPPSSETPEETERKRGNLYFIWASVAVLPHICFCQTRLSSLSSS